MGSFCASLNIGDGSEVLNKLYSMLETDKDVPVRITIIATLGSFNNPAVIPSLQKALKDPVPEVDLAGLGLKQMGKPSGCCGTKDQLQFHE